MQAWSMAGAGAEVLVRRGQLMLRALSPIPALYRGFLLHPDDDKDPYVFRIDLSKYGIGAGRVVFGREPATGTTSFYLDGILLSLRKHATTKDPRLWATGMLGALGVATAANAVRRRRTTGCGDDPT